jgi:hypothetical protein
VRPGLVGCSAGGTRAVAEPGSKSSYGESAITNF